MRYFHEKTKQRRNFNRITAINDEERRTWFEDKDINRVIIAYFTKFYATQCREDADLFLQPIQLRVTPQMNLQLTKPVTEEEIYAALQQMNADKSPGPDGMNVGFYKQHWKAIGKGVVNFVKHFFTYGTLNPEINQTHICLIPKIESPMQVKDYRPISLCNVAISLCLRC